ncbi:ExeM/NucH family extracellular endonuclease, partial [Dietzia sp.]|uniref:ExeM/NucH family extracellular endonuclease n=1 Tax=Dietzia sp. TaxID=1871616 RepID=UPI002FD9FC08
KTVTIQGIVTGTFQQAGSLDGYYIQDAGDDDAATSDGMFVYARGGDARAVGDTVRVQGKVSEYYGNTQVTQSSVEVCGTGAELPAPATVGLPLDPAKTEALENMRVQLASGVINEAYDYDRYGELVLGSKRHEQPTNRYAPGSDEAKALAAENAADSITLDDGLGIQNPNPLRGPNGEDYSAQNRFRIGDTVKDATGVLNYSHDAWRIQPTAGATVENTNPRTDAPKVPGSITVASANVLNYFTTLTTEDKNARGANSPEEFARQKTKIVDELASIHADVFGLMEIENNDGHALDDLVAGLNAKLGSEEYKAIETGTVGTDAITTAMIYKPAKVDLVGDHKILDSLVDPDFDTNRHRPAIAQVFKDKATGEDFTVAVNHLKSKGSDCGAGDPEDPNGQGNCNATRVKGAKALTKWLTSDPELSGSGRELIIGDLNSYAKEDPIAAIEEAGFTNMVEKFNGPSAYSYVFDGQTGYLDHALASEKLAGEIEGVSDWHNNSDEPDANDYNLDYGRDPAYFEDNAYRASDHDPVVIGFTPGGNGNPGNPGEPGDGDDSTGSLSGISSSIGGFFRGVVGSVSGLLGRNG